MKARDYRQLAWKKISEQKKWGILALITLVHLLIVGAIGGFSAIPFIGFMFSICAFLIAGAFEYAINGIALSVSYDEPTKIEDLFKGFNNFSRNLVAYLLVAVFTALWSLLFVIPGIIKGISYSMTFFIMNDDPNIDSNEARKVSMKIMDGHKWEYFCLCFSFIGWVLLCGLTLGILTFWITPYMNASFAEFYNNIKPKNVSSEEDKINADEIFE